MIGQELTGDPCSKCEAEFFQLVDRLIKDIQHLESKAVHLRYSLSSLLSEYDGESLRYDIFSDLSRSHYDQPAYQKYIANCHDGDDPMDDAMYCDHLLRLAYGEESIGL
jgi:hypothetical protein